MNTSSVMAGFIGVVGIAVGLVFGFTIWHKDSVQQQQQLAQASPAGTSFSTAKIAEAVLVPTTSGAGATSTSILNTDANDRIVTDAGVSCTGATAAVFGTGSVAEWSFKAGTTTTANPPALGVAGSLAMNVVMATGTYDGFTATSTYTLPAARRWATGTYMSFTTNATSSVIVECTPFVHYLGQ